MEKYVEVKIQVRKSKTDDTLVKMARRAVNELSLYPMIPIYNPRIYIRTKTPGNVNKCVDIIRDNKQYLKRELKKDEFTPDVKFSGLANIEDVKVLFNELSLLYLNEDIEAITSLTIYFNLEEKDNSWKAGIDADRLEATFYGRNWKPNIERSIINSVATGTDDNIHLDKAMIKYLYNKDIINEDFIRSLPLRFGDDAF